MLVVFHLDRCLQLIYPESPHGTLRPTYILVMNLNKLFNFPKLELPQKHTNKIKQKKMFVELQREDISANILVSPSLPIFEIVFLTDFHPPFFTLMCPIYFPFRFPSFLLLTFSKTFYIK